VNTEETAVAEADERHVNRFELVITADAEVIKAESAEGKEGVE
jgi:hypothetical protein